MNYLQVLIIPPLSTANTELPVATQKSDWLEEWLGDEMLSDVVFVFDDGAQMPANKYILATRSQVFADKFEHEMEDGRIEIKDTDSKVFTELLKYIYTGYVSSMEEYASEMLHLANKVCYHLQ